MEVFNHHLQTLTLNRIHFYSGSGLLFSTIKMLSLFPGKSLAGHAPIWGANTSIKCFAKLGGFLVTLLTFKVNWKTNNELWYGIGLWFHFVYNVLTFLLNTYYLHTFGKIMTVITIVIKPLHKRKYIQNKNVSTKGRWKTINKLIYMSIEITEIV